MVTVLLVSHRWSAIRWCERAVLLDGGRAVADGGWEAVLDDSERLRELLSAQTLTPA